MRRMADPVGELHARELDGNFGGARTGASPVRRARLARDAAVAEHAASAGDRAGDGHDAHARRGQWWANRGGAGAGWARFPAGARYPGFLACALVSDGVARIRPAPVAGYAGHERRHSCVDDTSLRRHGRAHADHAAAGSGGATAHRLGSVHLVFAPRACDLSA